MPRSQNHSRTHLRRSLDATESFDKHFFPITTSSVSTPKSRSHGGTKTFSGSFVSTPKRRSHGGKKSYSGSTVEDFSVRTKGSMLGKMLRQLPSSREDSFRSLQDSVVQESEHLIHSNLAAGGSLEFNWPEACYPEKKPQAYDLDWDLVKTKEIWQQECLEQVCTLMQKNIKKKDRRRGGRLAPMNQHTPTAWSA
jgi:hypothetical protein